MEVKNMLLSFTDVFGTNVFVNPEYVVAIFTAQDGEHEGKTAITLINGNVLVGDDLLEVVGAVNGAQ